VLPTKKKPAKAKREALPTIEVDVDDEAAIADVAEALVTAILAAAVERGTGTAPGAARKKAKPAAKSRAKKAPTKRPRAKK